MTAETREAVQPSILQPGEGRLIDELHLRILATGASTGETLCAGICTNPGPGGPALHTHRAHDELYLVFQHQHGLATSPLLL